MLICNCDESVSPIAKVAHLARVELTLRPENIAATGFYYFPDGRCCTIH